MHLTAHFLSARHQLVGFNPNSCVYVRFYIRALKPLSENTCFVYTRLRRKSLSVTESDCETVTFRSLKHEADRNVLVFPIVWSSTGAPDSTVVLYLVELCSYFIPDVSERASESKDGFNTLSTSRHSHNKWQNTLWITQITINLTESFFRNLTLTLFLLVQWKYYKYISRYCDGPRRSFISTGGCSTCCLCLNSGRPLKSIHHSQITASRS